MGLFASASNAYSQTLILYSEHYPPYSIDNSLSPDASNASAKQQAAGLDVDIIRAAYHAKGIGVKFHFFPWKRVMRDVELGHALGAISCRRTIERDKFIRYSTPVSQSRLAFVSNINFKGERPDSFEDLKSLKVVVVSGYAPQSNLAENNVKHSVVSSSTQGLNLVQHRDQYILITGWEGAAFEAQRLGYSDTLQFNSPSLASGAKNFHICFSKKHPESKKWRNIFNEGLKDIEAQGIVAEIRQKYGLKH